MKRALIAGGVVLVAVPVAVIGAAAWFLNGDAVKAQLVEQVRRSTGRELTIAGPVTLGWSLSPTIALSDLSLSNPPGFARPQMAHVDRLDVQLALAPLLNREIDVRRISIARPSVQLERNAAGQPNWDFRPPAAPTTAPTTSSQPRADRFRLMVGSVEISDATVTSGAQTFTVPHVAYDPDTGRVAGSLVASGMTFALGGTAGPIAATAYPIDLHLNGDGVAASLTGTSAAATLSITTADLAALLPLVGRALPSVRDVTMSAALPGPTALHVRAGAASFGAFSVQQADLAAASLNDPATLNATAAAGALPVSVTGHLGSIAGLLGGVTPIDARIEAPSLVGTASGTVAATGVARLHLAVDSPDLAAAGVQAGLALPVLTNLKIVSDASIEPGTTVLTGLQLTSAQGDIGGALTVTSAGRPALRGTLTSRSFDLGALRLGPLPPSAVSQPAVPASAPPASPAGPVVPAPPARMIPDIKLPVATLGVADADLRLTADTLHVGASELHAVQAHAVLQNGTLRLDPISTAIGAATAHATVELAAQPPALHITVDAASLPFGPIAALAGGAATAPGTLDLRADLAGTGDTLRAVAATLNGHAGLALVDAQLDNAVLERLAAGPLRAANLSLDGGGGTTIRCAALRADATAGHVDFRALTIDTSKFALDGSGDLSLADETMDLHLRPQLRLGGGLSVPVRVRGTFVAPKVALDPGALAAGRVGIVIGGAAPADTCGPALALARDGQAGATAAPPPAAKPMKPADLLRGLLR